MMQANPDGSVTLRLQQVAAPDADALQRESVELQRKAIEDSRLLITGLGQQQQERHVEAQRTAGLRHTEQLAAQRKLHAEQLEAIQRAAVMPPAELALHILAALPPTLSPEDEAAVVARRVRLVMAYAAGDVAPAPQPAPEPTPQPTPAPAPEPEPSFPAPTPIPSLPMLTHAGFAQMRGANSFNAGRNAHSPADLAALRAAGANHARVWFEPQLERTSAGPVYLVPQHQVNRLLNAADYCETIGLRLVLCPGFHVDDDFPWGDDARMTAYVDMWIALARTFKGRGVIAGFDLMNEPRTREPQALPGAWSPEQFAQVDRDWRDLALAIVGAVRAIDPQRICIYQIGLGGDPSRFEEGRPLPLQNVWESAHVYPPHSFTHQHAHVENPAGLPFRPYSDADRLTLAASQERMARWSERHGRGIYYGEFSANRFADGAAAYVREVAAFAQARKWPTAYHEWRGWPAWDAEAIGPPGDNSRSDTAPTLAVLREHWAS